MATGNISEEMKQALGRFRDAEEIYVLMSDFTRMPYVECDADTMDDEIFLYFDEDDAKFAASARIERGQKVHVVQFIKRFLLPFYTSLYPMGVNCIVADRGYDSEVAVQLEDLVFRNKEAAEKEGKIVIENPEFQLTALYFMQKLRALKEPMLTEELQALNEEMMAHYMRGRYIVAVTEDKTFPVLKQKDGKVMQPIFTDMQEFMKFQSFSKDETLKTAVVDASKIQEITTKEAFGVTVNPFGVNVVLQLPKKETENE